MSDAHTADYARAREAFATLPLEEKLGFLFDASMLTVARTVESVGACVSSEMSDFADNLRGEARKAVDAMGAFADEAAEKTRAAAAQAEAFADDLAEKARAAADEAAQHVRDAADHLADEGIEPTDEPASEEVEKMLDDLFGPDDDADDATDEDASL